MAKMIHPLWPLKIMNQLQAGADFLARLDAVHFTKENLSLEKLGALRFKPGTAWSEA